jgi:ribosomal protein L40E
VALWRGERPGVVVIGREGQLIITDQRVCFVKYLNPLLPEKTDYSLIVDEGLRNKGSFEVSVSQILETEVCRFWLSAAGEPHLRVYCGTRSRKTAFVFRLLDAPSGKEAAQLQQIAMEIDRLKGAEQEQATKVCPRCGHANPPESRFCNRCASDLIQEDGHTRVY